MVEGFEETVKKHKPTIVIHCAWGGVDAASRNSEAIQHDNLIFTHQLLNLATACSAKRFIALGSQAEYGYLEKVAHENQTLHPTDLYGKTKVKASELVRQICQSDQINWYWLRLFAFYGPADSPQWLIPYTIDSLLKKKKAIEFGPCTQKYAYLYVKDLAAYISLLINNENSPSGIYNISGNQSIELKKLLRLIRRCIPDTTTQLVFDALPMRENQSILIKGNMRKFHAKIGRISLTPLNTGLEETIAYHKFILDENKSI
jgi:nucleoside-diphosphate-sugar epimerase